MISHTHGATLLAMTLLAASPAALASNRADSPVLRYQLPSKNIVVYSNQPMSGLHGSRIRLAAPAPVLRAKKTLRLSETAATMPALSGAPDMPVGAADFPVIAPEVQRARDQERYRMIAVELQNQQAALRQAQARSAPGNAVIERQRGDIAALSRELTRTLASIAN
ncbi:hypothetical protein GJA_1653 [Janthinobacterium agaricidamnosum NBRC 102515 = DSM 9628]|uniref:Uncharacterized protein n=2 Tax=Janthinobacterium agaricidamnosum TaxID=55508 RepID=W0V340_9BURK|nr:hypothetical protein GJA_1653 [Janthinobacterium agaricidamnosum NBRC 102515 = DSM 9628]